jgi:hypothetical protein
MHAVEMSTSLVLMVLLGVASVVLLVAGGIGFARTGDNGAVRRALVAGIVLALVAGTGTSMVLIDATPREVLTGLLYATGVLALFYLMPVAHTLETWRMAPKLGLRPAHVGELSKRRRRKLERATEHFERLGFRVVADKQWSWQVLDRPQHAFIRYFAHGTEPYWAEVAVSDVRRAIIRKIGSRTKTDQFLLTADVLQDQAALPVDHITTGRVGLAATTDDLLEAHKKLLAWRRGSNLACPVDPLDAASDMHHSWATTLVERGVLSLRNGDVAMAKLAIPGVMFRRIRSAFL